MWTFMGEHPVAAFFIAWLAAWAVVSPFRFWFRSRNIQAHGWPPDHLDADGDIHRPECQCQSTTNE